jgi:hypothetical protein
VYHDGYADGYLRAEAAQLTPPLDVERLAAVLIGCSPIGTSTWAAASDSARRVLAALSEPKP